MRTKTISIGALAALALAAGCGGDEPQTAPTVTVALPSSSTTTSTTSTTTSTSVPPVKDEPSGPAETATADPRVTELERQADRTVSHYVAALDARDGEAACAVLAPGVIDQIELPEPRADCAASLEASIGYRDPRGLPVWDGATVPNVRVSEIDARSATVTATVVSHFADREDSVEDDVVYLTRAGGHKAPQQRRGSATPRWLIAKPSATLYRAVGIADVPPSVLAPPG